MKGEKHWYWKGRVKAEVPGSVLLFHYLDSLKARKVQPSRTQFILAKKPGITSKKNAESPER